MKLIFPMFFNLFSLDDTFFKHTQLRAIPIHFLRILYLIFSCGLDTPIRRHTNVSGHNNVSDRLENTALTEQIWFPLFRIVFFCYIIDFAELCFLLVYGNFNLCMFLF